MKRAIEIETSEKTEKDAMRLFVVHKLCSWRIFPYVCTKSSVDAELAMPEHTVINHFLGSVCCVSVLTEMPGHEGPALPMSPLTTIG